MTNVLPAVTFCDACGRPVEDVDAAHGPPYPRHVDCADQRTLEPPRYCPSCGRRLVVQVLPAGWTARCSRHGELAAPD